MPPRATFLFLILAYSFSVAARALLSTVGDSETAWWSDNYIYDLEETIEFIEFNNQGIGTLLYGVFRKESDDVIGYVQIKLSQARLMSANWAMPCPKSIEDEATCQKQ